MNKLERDRLILHYLTKFRICSRNQLAAMVFKGNSNPVNVTNRVMKRLCLDGSCLPVRRTKDKSYLYTANPAAIHHRSNKIEHCLKIVDFFIKENCPDKFVIEPILGAYCPDVFFKDGFNRSICVEIQITPISVKKMQDKIDRFVNEFGKEHDSKLFVLCSDTAYHKITIPQGFKLIRQPLPKEVEFN